MGSNSRSMAALLPTQGSTTTSTPLVRIIVACVAKKTKARFVFGRRWLDDWQAEEDD